MIAVVPMARSKKRWAALASRRADTNTVDELPGLVDRAVDVAPAAGDPHVGLVDLPAVTDAMTAGPGRLGQQQGKPLHPPIGGDVVDLDAAFNKQLIDVAVRQRQAQVPAHREGDHLRREAETGDGRSRADPVQEFLRLAHEHAPVDDSEPTGQLAQEQVLGDTELRNERQLLVIVAMPRALASAADVMRASEPSMRISPASGSTTPRAP
jgi:hypothetical protein